MPANHNAKIRAYLLALAIFWYSLASAMVLSGNLPSLQELGITQNLWLLLALAGYGVGSIALLVRAAQSNHVTPLGLSTPEERGSVDDAPLQESAPVRATEVEESAQPKAQESA